MKILYLCPHLATGGGPKVVSMTVAEMLKYDHEIYVIDYSNTGGDLYAVQKDEIREMVGDDKLFVFNSESDEDGILDTIHSINPDIIHLQEFAEMFLSNNMMKELYEGEFSKDYKLVETSHKSDFRMEHKKVIPDGLVFINKSHQERYKMDDVPNIIWFPEFERIERPDRKSGLEKLGLDPNKKHVLNVGVWNWWKNQGEVLDYALRLPEVEFHFLGSQAVNFREFWEPLMERKENEKIDNCTVWGEVSDVDSYYSCMDLHLFTSKPHGTMAESMPVALKESVLKWGMPTFLYPNKQYDGLYDDSENAFFLTDDKDKNSELIQEILYGIE